MRRVGHVARMGRGEVYTGFCWGDPSDRDQLDDTGTDGFDYLITQWSRVLLRKLNDFQILKKFMETEGLLPHSQEPPTCTYPEPARSNLRLVHIPLPENPG